MTTPNESSAATTSPHYRVTRWRKRQRAYRAALAFWVDRAERFEEELPQGLGYMKARGVLNESYQLGLNVRDEVRRG